jgi:hypothetical protein
MSGDMTREQIDEALRLSVGVGARQRETRMALRTTGEVIPDVRPAGQHTADDLVYMVLDLIDTIDGDEPGLDEARAICAEPDALRTLLAARNRIWSDLRMRGRLFALCPHCGRRESSFDLSTLALVLRMPPPPLFSPDDVFPEVPALANRRRPGTRLAEAPATPRLRILFPSGLLGLEPRTDEAVLRDLETEEGQALEVQAWARWAPDDRTPPSERSHWRRASPGFRAILRSSVALASVDGIAEVTAQRVEDLSLADFLFLDAAYFLTHHADQPRPDALVVTCEDCGGEYLPLR